MTDKPMLILIAGPYRSGTNGDPQAMAANLHDVAEIPRHAPQGTA
ncbi:hypothetical protein GCM10009837_45840 [Streptomyces durmitorensis]